ncbi:flagellar export protein FliJ [Desulfatirhabdium butyrativorans]|uniref:flagellar export protein FliJ n=1 Tax=Desulfatirhabdium butyrativorans TaxID=340467 RepID=UPI000414725A|nr:flagellar export protein FliJ [Desulfatirhabdium butyrativorans]
MFTFRLEPVLKHRKHQEEMLQKELSLLLRKTEQQRSALQCCFEKLARLMDEVQSLQEEGVTISEQILYCDCIERQKLKIDCLEREIAKMENQVDIKRKELLEAVKKRKMMEKLKENKNFAYIEDMLKMEQKLLDEAAVCRFKIGTPAMAG